MRCVLLLLPLLFLPAAAAAPDGKVRWLHIPKTGTWFAKLPLLAQCPRAHERLDELYKAVTTGRGTEACMQHSLLYYHLPLGRDSLQRAAVVFRDPLSRSASGFAHGLHDCTHLRNDSAPCGGNWTLYRECVRGCQTNMLLRGRPCGGKGRGRLRFSRSEVKAALKKVGFLGMHSRHAETVCQFALTHGIPLNHTLPLVVNTRPSARPDCELMAEQEGGEDPEDELLYLLADQEFERRLLPACRRLGSLVGDEVREAKAGRLLDDGGE